MNQNCQKCAHCVKVELLDLPNAGTIFHFCDESHVGCNPDGLRDDSSLDESWAKCLGEYRKECDNNNEL